mgnify:FL=1
MIGGFTMKAVVDKNTCIGCGLCPSICPEEFSMDDDGLAVAIDEELDEGIIDSAKEAEESCPVSAISVG